jgi:hypothetical protein
MSKVSNGNIKPAARSLRCHKYNSHSPQEACLLLFLRLRVKVVVFISEYTFASFAPDISCVTFIIKIIHTYHSRFISEGVAEIGHRTYPMSHWY